jgi:hypothetical protein
MMYTYTPGYAGIYWYILLSCSYPGMHLQIPVHVQQMTPLIFILWGTFLIFEYACYYIPCTLHRILEGKVTRHCADRVVYLSTYPDILCLNMYGYTSQDHHIVYWSRMCIKHCADSDHDLCNFFIQWYIPGYTPIFRRTPPLL